MKERKCLNCLCGIDAHWASPPSELGTVPNEFRFGNIADDVNKELEGIPSGRSYLESISRYMRMLAFALNLSSVVRELFGDGRLR